MASDSNSASNYLPDIALEIQADRLLQAHNAADDPEYPARPDPMYSTRAQRHQRRRGELSLEEMAEHNDVVLPVPPESIARLVGQALKASATKKQARMWALKEAGYTNRRIAQLMDCHEVTVSKALAAVRAKLYATIDEQGHWFHVYLIQTYRRPYSAPAVRDPLPSIVEAAREMIENCPDGLPRYGHKTYRRGALWYV